MWFTIRLCHHDPVHLCVVETKDGGEHLAECVVAGVLQGAELSDGERWESSNGNECC